MSAGAVDVGEPRGPLGGGSEQHPMVVVVRSDTQSRGQVGLPGAGRAQEDNAPSFGDEPIGCQQRDLLAYGGPGILVELLDRFRGGEPCCADPQLGTRRVACCDFAIEDRGEIFPRGSIRRHGHDQRAGQRLR